MLAKREAGIGHVFLIHGNIADWQKNMKGQYQSLQQYLLDTFKQRLIVYYSLSTGLSFFSDEAEAEFRNLCKGLVKKPDPAGQPAMSPAVRNAAAELEKAADKMPLTQLVGETPQAVLGKLEELMKTVEKASAKKGAPPAPKLAIIIDFAHNIAPGAAAGGAAAAATDRVNIEILERWANSRWIATRTIRSCC